MDEALDLCIWNWRQSNQLLPAVWGGRHTYGMQDARLTIACQLALFGVLCVRGTPEAL